MPKTHAIVTLAVFVLGIALGVANPAHATVEGHLGRMFEQLGMKSNATAPAIYETARRGVISGGGFEARSRIIRPNIITFRPPSFKAGCGGISFHGGALSFINAQQFQDTLRAIAANSVGLLSGYAFTMALDAMCEKCGQKISELAAKIQEIAGKLRNTCEAAKTLTAFAKDSMGALADEQANMAAQVSAEGGVVSDFLAGINKAADKVLAGLNSTQKKQFTGNVIWKAFEDSDYADWFGASNYGASARQLIMSLTGTFVVTVSSEDSEKLDYKPVAPTIDLEQFMDGGTTELLTCYDSECLSISPTVVTYKGFRERVAVMLLGDGSGANPGIIAKFRSTNASLQHSTDEKNFMAAMRPQIAGLLADLSNRRAAVTVFQDSIVDVIAAEMTASYIREALDSLEYAVRAIEQKGTAKVTPRMQELRQRLPDLRRQATEYNQMMIQALQMADDARTVLRASR